MTDIGETQHVRYEVNAFADACRECGEAWPCRTVLLAENERLRGSIRAIRRVSHVPADIVAICDAVLAGSKGQHSG